MGPDATTLRLSNVSAAYGRIAALHNVNFDLPPGRCLAVLGANGAGKTTLLRAISGLMVRRNGSISYKDKDLAQLAPHEIVSLGISHVPEGKHLFGPLTVSENVEIGALTLSRSARRQDIAEARDLVYSLFPILRERATQEARTLSGGEQQMLAIARALMSRPKILLLDEPSVGLAPKVNEVLFAALAKLKEMKLAIIVAEQLIRLACDIADRVVVLHLGRIAMQGDPQVVRTDPELKRLYLGG